MRPDRISLLEINSIDLQTRGQIPVFILSILNLRARMLVEIVYTPRFPFYDSLFVQQFLLIAVVFLWWYSRDLPFTARTMARNQLSWSSLLHLFVTKLSSNGDSASNLKGTLPLATRPATTSYGSYESMLDDNRKWNFIIEIRLKVILLIDGHHTMT